MSARTTDKCMRGLRGLSLRVALVLSYALCAVQCAIEPPAGVYVCSHGERCPVRQYCHVSDGLCHGVPEVPDSLNLDPDDSGTGLESDAYVDANSGPDRDDGGGGGPALECAEGDFECVGTRYRVCSAAGRAAHAITRTDAFEIAFRAFQRRTAAASIIPVRSAVGIYISVALETRAAVIGIQVQRVGHFRHTVTQPVAHMTILTHGTTLTVRAHINTSRRLDGALHSTQRV